MFLQASSTRRATPGDASEGGTASLQFLLTVISLGQNSPERIPSLTAPSARVSSIRSDVSNLHTCLRKSLRVCRGLRGHLLQTQPFSAAICSRGERAQAANCPWVVVAGVKVQVSPCTPPPACALSPPLPPAWACVSGSLEGRPCPRPSCRCPGLTWN